MPPPGVLPPHIFPPSEGSRASPTASAIKETAADPSGRRDPGVGTLTVPELLYRDSRDVDQIVSSNESWEPLNCYNSYV